MIDLFTSYGDNLLPYDGEVNYYGRILQDPNTYLDTLLKEIPWRQDEVFVNGERRKTKRKVAWYGDVAYQYRYSGITRKALPFNKELLELKGIVEKKLDFQFNSCLCNLYADGNEAMTWHSDDEASLGTNTTIASLSLGAERKFLLKHKRSKQLISLVLGHGSLCVMKESTQTYWLHCLPKTIKVLSPRINLTFRTIVKM